MKSAMKQMIKSSLQAGGGEAEMILENRALK
jgi:hypothetical protein